MYKKTIKYTDYNGNERSEDFYFNFNKAEAVELELGTVGGLSETITRISGTQDIPKLIEIFKNLVLKAYGEKSPDGREFIKNEKLLTSFKQTEAYSELFMELATNADEAAKFINGILPHNIDDVYNASSK